MNQRLSESELCTRAWDVLKQRLGPAEAMRFLALIRNPPRDYQRWRDEHFKDLTTDQLMNGMRARSADPS